MEERGAGTESGLGGNHHVLAASAQRLAENLLRLSFRVYVGGVEKINAGVESLADDLSGQGFVDLGDGGEQARARSESHGAEGHAGNHESCISESRILHVLS